MSGLSLASHPRLAGAGRHRFGANHVVCALALCALVLRARPCGGFACFASCRSPLPGHAGPPALTHLACPRVWRGRSLCSLGGVPCWGLLWACLLAGGWVSCFGVGVLAWGGGTVWSRRPCPACLVGAHASGVGLLACAVVLRARWAEGGLVGAGQPCPAPYSVALPPLRCAWMRKRVGVPARSGENTHTEGGRRAGWKLACSLAWCVQPTGGVKGEVGIGPCRAGLASVRAIVGLGGDWVARLPSWWWGWVGGNDFPR